MDLYYKHSGRFTPFGVLVGAFAGAAASIPLAWLYSYGIIQMPYLKLRALSTLCFALAVGWSTGLGLVWGKVRNNFVATLAGLVTSVFALYVSWVFWLLQLSVVGKYSLEHFKLLLQPLAVWDLVRQVRGIGTWGTSGTEATHGTELSVIWSIEAVIVIAIGTLSALAVLKRKPFCDNCESWCTRSEKLIFFPRIFGDDLKQRLEMKDFSFVEKLVPTSEKFAHIRFELFSCSSCDMLNTISVTQLLIQPAKSRWSQAKTERKELAAFLLVTSEDAALIRRVSMGAAGPPAVSSSAVAAK